MSTMDKCSECGGHNTSKGYERLLCALFGEKVEKKEPDVMDSLCWDCIIRYLKRIVGEDNEGIKEIEKKWGKLKEMRRRAGYGI